MLLGLCNIILYTLATILVFENFTEFQKKKKKEMSKWVISKTTKPISNFSALKQTRNQMVDFLYIVAFTCYKPHLW